MKRLRSGRNLLWRRASDGGNIWLIIFSDITTNLMLFFLMCFALTRMTSADREMITAGLEGKIVSRSVQDDALRERALKKEKEEKAIQSLNDEVSRGTLAGQANLSVTDESVQITLNPEAFFATGSAELNRGTIAALEGLVKSLREFPNDIIIEGHTDNVPIRGGIYRSNWELSVARAVSVIDFFISRGVRAAQLVAGGYGEYQPAYPNDTPENRA
ncbi:MAG: flagellar motor protein MotB, partial [bacterium]